LAINTAVHHIYKHTGRKNYGSNCQLSNENAMLKRDKLYELSTFVSGVGFILYHTQN